MISKQVQRVIPFSFIVLGLGFGITAITVNGFWDPISGPLPGFFPAIMAVLLVVVSTFDFIRSLKTESEVKYHLSEFLVIAAGIGIYLFTFVIGLVPTLFLYIVLWLRLVEKSSWKIVLIISAITAFLTIGVFGMWLGVRFPMGLFDHLI